MLRSVLIGLDSSADSDRAVELGIQWASKLNLRLAGLGIVDEPTIRRPEPMPIGGGYYRAQSVQGLLEQAHHKVEQSLQQFGARCAEAGLEYLLLDDAGVPCEEILRESQAYDLVMLGHATHFRLHSEGRADETLPSVLKRTPRPVVIVPPTPHQGSAVVVAYDGSPSADHALQAFQSSGLDMHEPASIVCIDSNREQATTRAERAAKFLRSHDIFAMPIARQAAGSVAQTILDEVRQRNARLLVMGAYGHSALREFLLGSVTNAMLSESPVPAFLCH